VDRLALAVEDVLPTVRLFVDGTEETIGEGDVSNVAAPVHDDMHQGGRWPRKGGPL